MNDHLFDLLLPLREEEINRYIMWSSYEIGFTGNGTTALDIQPDFPKPTLSPLLQQYIDTAAEKVSKSRRDTFRTTCIETLGEDPNDW